MSEQQYLDKATLAGGCFWCMEPPFDALEGVVATISGYAGGDEQNPTYQQVSSGQTGHAEVIQITYDRRKLSFKDILDVYWKQIDPTTPNRQIAEESKRALDASVIYSNPIVTEIKPLEAFYPAEDYHQDYYQQNPLRYSLYHDNSGHDEYLEKIWGEKK